MKHAIAALCLLTLSTAANAESGIASVYGNGDGYAGKCVAMQKPGGGCARMDPHSLIAAHRTRRLGSTAQVTNQRNGLTVTVRIVDRGPFVHGRIVDLSPEAARQIGCDGLCPVEVQ